MQARNGEPEMPENLQRAFLLDQTHIMASKDLNMLFFAPNSQFRQDLAGLQGITSMKEGLWTRNSRADKEIGDGQVNFSFTWFCL